jgi:hypothetical protein
MNPKEMTNKEIEKIIHKWMGKCWHESTIQLTACSYRWKCRKCGDISEERPTFPAYCSDNSPRKLLNDVLEKMTDKQRLDMYVKLTGTMYGHSNELLAISARQICEAIVEVVKGE